MNRTASLALAGALTLGLGGAASVALAIHTDQQAEAPPAATTEPTSLGGQLSRWPEASQLAAITMLFSYGLPAETTPNMWIWYDNGPWKRTIVHRQPVQHFFPVPHEDVLEQVIDYRVPVDAFDDLARFDGSVTAQRTAGELSARCDREEMNFLALNLAAEIATRQRSVDVARAFYAETAMRQLQGVTSRYVEGLLFDPQERVSADPDVPAVELPDDLFVPEIVPQVPDDLFVPELVPQVPDELFVPDLGPR